MYAFSETLSAWAPALVVLGIAYTFLPLLDRERTLPRVVLATFAAILSLRYLIWRYTETLAPLAPTWDALASWSFFFLEAFAMLSSLSAFALLARYRNRSRDADEALGWWGKDPPKVAVFIATYNEEWQILERTIAGVRALRWPNKHVYVLDDGQRPWLADACKALDVSYIARADNTHGKAGNLNHAREALKASGAVPDYVAVLDADFVPHQGFISRSLSLFSDPTIGLVQTPQHFFNPDPIQHNLGISRAYPDEQRFFFDHQQPSRDAWGVAVCCGTSSIVRWEALEAIGGFPTASVTEDYLLSVRLQEQRYSTAYLNEPLSEGLAPEGLREYITQRARWGMGLMQIVRSASGPLRPNSLRIRDRWSMIDSFVYWASIFPFKLACIIYPLLFWYFGVVVLDAQLDDIISHFAPYYLMSMFFINFVSGGLFVPIVHDVSQIVGAWEISRGVYTGLLRPKGQKFKVTVKGGDRSRMLVQWPLLWRFMTLFVVTFVGLAFGLVTDYQIGSNAADAKIVILFWTLYNLAVLALVMLVCFEAPRTSAVLRRSPERVRIELEGQEHHVWLVDLNEDALRLRGIALPRGTRFVAHIDQMGPVEAVVFQSLEGTTEANLTLSPAIRLAMHEKLHTREGEPGTGIVATAALLAGIGRRIVSGGFRSH
ncbi:glycosyltransferase [Pelagibacterium xiamenense]|uniref:glycosyltransferase n=1 Tax=Pelagibacterium xiamenense TaxID=2901140 RepID=UPI001E56B4B8|nr:cellulose synthase catalytic subunit [Pelagibacterium xiamenense]MCD7060126.1 glycosyltransferase [Pelagibacterium xiamenense]